MSAEKPIWYYFGCRTQPGHYLHNENMHSVHDNKLRKLNNFDSLLPPHDDTKPYIATFSRLGGWGMSAIAFWDYSVDSRGGCNSVFYVNSLTIEPEAMMEEAKKRFPSVFGRFPTEVVFHPSVLGSNE